MTSVESRIVTMKFDNSTFERGVSTTLAMLDKLKLAITGLGGTKSSIGGVDASGATTGLSHVASAADQVGSHFSAMEVVAISVLATIASEGARAAESFLSSFTLGPVMDGLQEYQTNLQSIQTIQANTDQPLPKITAALDELNRYSDRTIYNFSEMAKNIGTFTAAGVDLKNATSAIKGIANIAALSGSTSAQASNAMYQLSQALASGKVSLMDWNSVVNAGMGGKKLQTQLAQTAVAMGALDKDAITTAGSMDQLKINGQSFRESMMAAPGQEPWMTSDVLANGLAALDGRFSMLALTTEKTTTGVLKYTEAQAKAKIEAARLALEQKNGVKYTDEQFKAVMQLSDSSFLAATQVKTLGQVFDVARETIGSGWSATFRNIFGDFGEAKKTFTDLSNFINDKINAVSLARNKMLAEWNKKGGRDTAIEGIVDAFTALGRILKPIGRAFRDVFPATTADRLLEMTDAFANFTHGLLINKAAMHDIREIFGAIFGVLGVGVEIVKGILHYIFSFIGLLAGGTGGLLDFSGSVAHVVKQLTDWILKGDYIANFFDKIIAGRAAVLGPVIHALSELLSWLAGIVHSGADVAIETITGAFQKLGPIIDSVRAYLQGVGESVQTYIIDTFNKLKPVFDDVKNSISDAFGSISGGLSGVGSSIGGAAGGLGSLFDLGGATDTATNGINDVKGALSDLAPSTDTVRSGFDSLMGGLKSFGIFVAKLAGGSLLGIGKLGEMIVDGITSAFSGGSSAVGGAISSFFGWIHDAFSSIFAGMDFQDVLSLINTGVLIALGGTLTKFFNSFANVGKSAAQVLDGVTGQLKAMAMDVKSEAIKNIAIAVAILAAALWVLSTIPVQKLGFALGAITALFVGIVIAFKLMMDTVSSIKKDAKDASRMLAISAALVLFAGALLLLSVAVKILSTMSLAELARGLGAIAVMIAGIIVATKYLADSGGAKQIIGASIALGILAFSLTAMAGAIALFARLDTGMLVEGGAKVVALLLALNFAMKGFQGEKMVSAAAAILIISGALVIMAGAMKILASISGGDSIQAYLLLTGVLIEIAAAANAMIEALPGAAAMLLMAIAIRILGDAMIKLGEQDLWTLIKGLWAISAVLISLGVIAGALLYTGAILGLVMMGEAFLLIGLGVAAAGAGLMAFAVALGIIGVVGPVAIVGIIAAIHAFLAALPIFVQQFGATITAIAKVIKRTGPQMVQAFGVVLRAILNEITKSMPALGRTLIAFIAMGLRVIRSQAPNMVRTGFFVIDSLLNGLLSHIGEMTRTAVKIVLKFLDGIEQKMDAIVKKGVELAESFIRAVGVTLFAKAGEVVSNAGAIGTAIVTGVVRAIGNGISAVATAAANLAQSAIGAAMHKLGANSPSKEFIKIGGYVVDGFSNGMSENQHRSNRAASGMAQSALDTVRKSMQNVSDIVDSDINTTITPVLDLSRVQADAGRIGDMLATHPVSAGVSYRGASAILSDQERASADHANSGDDGPRQLILQQHNTSPKALDEVTIYRNTKSLIRFAKEALE